MLVEAKHYRNGQTIRAEIQAGRIVKLQPIPGENPDLPLLAPALFDNQINGGYGINFTSEDLSTDQVIHLAHQLQQHGIGRFLPTIITCSDHVLEHALQTIRNARELDPLTQQAIVGIHLEGPMIHAEDGPRGAHSLEHVRPITPTEVTHWQNLCNGLIRQITLAPEVDGAIELIAWLKQQSILVALGHTLADGQIIRAAVRAGAATTTHLGNGISAMLPRHANPIWEQLALDELQCSVIADGFHLTPAVLKSIVRVKGVAKTILTCDASYLAGCTAGSYRMQNTNLELREDGKLVLAGTPYLAGSSYFTNQCIRILSRDAEIPLADAITMASANPAKLLGFSEYPLMMGKEGMWMLHYPETGKAEVLKS